MILILKDGKEIEIFRQTCAFVRFDRYKRSRGSVEWNINPLECIQNESKGFFGISDKWGVGYYDTSGRNEYGALVIDPSQFKMLIPISSVCSIKDTNIWERSKGE